MVRWSRIRPLKRDLQKISLVLGASQTADKDLLIRLRGAVPWGIQYNIYNRHVIPL
jgi:hypothetical protein